MSLVRSSASSSVLIFFEGTEEAGFDGVEGGFLPLEMNTWYIDEGDLKHE